MHCFMLVKFLSRGIFITNNVNLFTMSIFYLLVLCPNILRADDLYSELRFTRNFYLDSEKNISSYPVQCFEILESFAQYASNFTMCSILNARPIRLCENCINQYISFRNKYQELLNTVVNGTSCKSIFISHDRLDAVLENHDNIIGIWTKGKCDRCYNWTGMVPTIRNDTKYFNKMFNDTMDCFINNIMNKNDVCEKCKPFYLQLDKFYKTLSTDAIGVDNVCMDIVDSMNVTRYIWSKTLNCCKIRISPEIVFLCCGGVITLLPLLFYLAVRYCGPIRHIPNVLKQSRFKQAILRTINSRND